MANHFIPEGAKRRRLEVTQGAMIDSAATWFPPTMPTSRLAGEALARDSVGEVPYHFDLAPSTAPSHLEASSWNKNNQPSQGFPVANARGQDTNDQILTSSSFLAPNYGSSTMMAGVSWNTVSAAPQYSTPQCMDWNTGGRPCQAEPSHLINPGLKKNSAQPNPHYLMVPLHVAPAPSYPAQISPYDANSSVYFSERIQSNALNTEVLVQTPAAISSQANLNPDLSSSVSCANNGLPTLVQVPCGVAGDELVCFGMVRMFKLPQGDSSAYR
jgi:hypothetical protein